jgi:hypothetical protein
MENLVEAPTLSSEEKMFLSFALGKAYEDQGDYKRSFEALNQGNQMNRSIISYNLADDEAYAERII